MGFFLPLGVSPVPEGEGPGAPSVWFLGRRDRGHPPERFDNAVRKTFTVSKEEMQRREAEWQRTQGKNDASKKS